MPCNRLTYLFQREPGLSCDIQEVHVYPFNEHKSGVGKSYNSKNPGYLDQIASRTPRKCPTFPAFIDMQLP